MRTVSPTGVGRSEGNCRQRRVSSAPYPIVCAIVSTPPGSMFRSVPAEAPSACRLASSVRSTTSRSDEASERARVTASSASRRASACLRAEMSRKCTAIPDPCGKARTSSQRPRVGRCTSKCRASRVSITRRYSTSSAPRAAGKPSHSTRPTSSPGSTPMRVAACRFTKV